MKRNKISILFLLLLGCFPLGATIPELHIAPFRYNFELKSTGISTITQDTSEQMWFSTSDHLYSFDGYRVQKIALPPHPSITTQSEIQPLHCDHKNRIWLALSNGICCYDQGIQKFSYYFPVPEDMLNMSNINYQIQKDRNGTLYFAARNGIFSLNKKHQQLDLLTMFLWRKVCSGYHRDERIFPDAI